MPTKPAISVPGIRALPGIDLSQYDVIYAVNADHYAGHFGPGGCVRFVKAATGVGNATGDWRAIARVTDHQGGTLHGLAIMTADPSTGRYLHSHQHAALCLSVNGGYIRVHDHINNGHVSTRDIRPDGRGAANQSGWFYVIGLPRTAAARVAHRLTPALGPNPSPALAKPQPASPARIPFAADMAGRQQGLEGTVTYSLQKLGYSPDAAGMYQFQQSNGLPQGPFDSRTYYKLYSASPVRGLPPSPAGRQVQAQQPYAPAARQPYAPPPSSHNRFCWLPREGFPATQAGEDAYFARLEALARR